MRGVMSLPAERPPFVFWIFSSLSDGFSVGSSSPDRLTR